MSRSVRGIVAAVIAIAALSPGLAGCGRDTPAVPGTEAIAPADRGDPLALTGTTLDGEPFDVASLRGRVVVINSWASWCAPCRDETPDLVALAKESDPAGVAFVGLNVTDDTAAAKAFVDEFGVPYPVVVDADGALLRTIPGVPPAALPSTVVLDPEGRVAARMIGPTDTAELTAEIARARAG